MGSKQDLAYDDPSKTFIGVRFVLLGFDSIEKDKTRSKLLECGGFDSGDYGPDCTHVIVEKLIYDDPLCITARRDGKTLVTALWVDHSFDVGMPVDPTSVMYRPLRALNGIPGAKSLVVCLTGYQRQDRDDIMTMVGLMGANFSKPLIANKVTHLVCYKFEGDKYELAKKMKKIKLINHRWLENSLKAWEILPEADYDKSGYELEMLEAEAKDSEEETEDVAAKNDVETKSITNPQNTKAKMKSPHQSLVKQEVSKKNLDLCASKSLTNVANSNEDLSNAGKEAKFDNIECPGKFLQEIPNHHLEMLGSCNTECPGKILSSLPSITFDDKMIFEGVDNDIASMSKSAKRSPHSSMSKSSGKSYSRRSPRKSSLPLCSERMDSNAGNPSTSNKLSGDCNISSLDKGQVDAGFVGMETPSNGTMLHLDKGEISFMHDKRKLTVSYGSSKMLKSSHDSETILEDESMVKRTDWSPSGSLIDGSYRMDNRVSPENNTSYIHESTGLNFTDNVTEVVTSVTRQKCSDIAHQPSLFELECRSLTSDLEAKDLSLSKTEHPIPQVGVQQSDQHNIEAPSPGTKITEVQAQLELPKRGASALHSKTASHRKPAKKTLGSRTRPSKGNATKPKDSCEIHKTLLQNDSAIRSIGEIEMEDYEKFGSSKKLEIFPPTSSGHMGQKTELNNLGISGYETIDKDGSMDDETEAPKEKEENEFDVALDIEKSAEIEAQHLENMFTDRRISLNDSAKQTDGSIIGAKAKAENFGKEREGIEAEMAVCSKESEVSESTLVQQGGEKNLTKGKKRPLKKTKNRALLMATNVGNSNEVGQNDGCNTKQIEEKTAAQNEEKTHSVGKMNACPSKKSKNLTELEKENSPFVMRSQNMSNDKKAVGKMMPKSSKKPLKDSKAANTDLDSAKVEQILKVTEPVWFILSGHKLQRKEFQQVIKRLKGRVCRDSHKWSYQATHFIVPDPVRRTEKFFAAAASGSWILKTDYLAASNEAGRFLIEEPYEWHKKCLTEDGAINLEAPRKWRLMKERTGHGAFYGMRIIIYGECIAPPLETLKRVIKAGDVPGMPRVDMWVQEFLRHEIPCVLADYLVEYVCKPGYSLERHVQYNTHVWAEKSFNNLVNRMEEVIEEAKKPEDHRIDDVACQVCGYNDRGDKMLICGDNGSAGCGIGVHINCCNPPFGNIQDEDWFCPTCSKKKEGRSIRKSPKKWTSKLKK
ncbi:BRCT domain-containing protein [Abeliophyllum distichum]|uniref:BRCT domain-containing protein n=1 Tax=Abeliophyllum distichum TaxID=126358 RepID=A0ABD1VUQ6_9LAMI